MLGNIFPLDSAKPFTDQEKIGHNRYHPEIPPVDSVKPGDTFRVDSREWFDGAIKNDDSAQHILHPTMPRVPRLSRPFRREVPRTGRVVFVDLLYVAVITRFNRRLVVPSVSSNGLFVISSDSS